MQRTVKYIEWPIETEKPQDNNNNDKNRREQTQNRKTLPENRNTNSNTEISIPNKKHTQRNTKLNRKTEAESQNTNHSHKRRKQKQGNSVKLYSFSCFIVFFFFWTCVLRFFRENMIAGYYYLGILNCKSISFPGYLFSPLPLPPGDRYFRLWGLRSILAPPGSSREDRKAKPRGVRSSIVLVPFLVQSRQPNVRHNY